MSSYILFEDNFYDAGEKIIHADNRGYRYGDGIFETMMFHNGHIVLQDFHMERLFSSLRLLKYILPPHWEADYFVSKVIALCERNTLQSARVRLSISRGNGHLRETHTAPLYLIEAIPLPATAYRLNEGGVKIDLYEESRKAVDPFSSIKTSNYLPYVMASLFAKERNLSDAFVLNHHGRICDSTIANVFVVKDRLLATPSLKEGAVAGVVRRYIIENAPKIGFEVVETAIDISMLHTADEIFLTNALNPVSWVNEFQGSTFSNSVCKELYRSLFKPLIE